MLERVIGHSRPRFVVFWLLLAALAGCNRAETSSYGSVEVVPSAVRAAACESPPAGHLRLDGMQVADVVTISAHELCHSWVVRKELPAGLYTVSWQADGGSERASWEVVDAGIVNVFPERTTRLRMLALEPGLELLSQASPDDDELDQW